MYKKGLVAVTVPPCAEYDVELGDCYSGDEHLHKIQDSADYREHGAGVAYLPHRCDEWVIGGPSEVRAMIEDLQAALAQIEAAAPSQSLKE